MKSTYTAKQVIALTGVERNSLNLLRIQKYVVPQRQQSGRRQLFFYSDDDIHRISRIVQLVRDGYSPSRAAERVKIEEESHKLQVVNDPASQYRRLLLTVNGKELATLLDAVARRQGWEKVEVLDRYCRWADSLSDRLKKELPGDLPDRPRSIEGALGNKEYSYVFVRGLGEALGIHTLLLDPLFARVEPASAVCLKLDLSYDFLPVGDSRDRDYGERSQYRIPWRRLPGTDAMLGSVTLDPGGRSDEHKHPGEEFVYAISGKPLIHLSRSGDFSLNPGECLHFDGTQIHSTENPDSQPAQLFVVRYYQAESGGTRGEIRRRFLNYKVPEPSSEEAAKMPAWLDAIVPAISHPDESDHVQDLAGFGQFLQQSRKHVLPSPTAALPEARLGRIEEGLEKVPAELLPEIARAYGVREVLLRSYLYPPNPGVAQIGAVLGKKRESDFAKADERLSGHGVSYWLPRHTLLFSDLSIVLITLEPGAGTEENSHPGFEALLVIDGVVSAYFSGQEQGYSAAAPSGILMYPSTRPHRVANETRRPAEVLVIRFR